MKNEITYPIKIVAKKTGLSLTLIRAWERRYKIVDPVRTNTNRRLYSDEDIEKLKLLKKATDIGYSISSLASFTKNQLQELLKEQIDFESELNKDYNEYVDSIMNSIVNLKPFTLEQTLSQIKIDFNKTELIENIVIPIISKIGDYWRDGKIRILNEHFATAILKNFLSGLIDNSIKSENAPRIIITTPKHQYHELGALISANIASYEGWKIYYLGTDLPAEEIIAAANQINAKAVILSIVYPSDDPGIPIELEKLHNHFKGSVDVVITGNSVKSYSKIINRINAKVANNSKELKSILQNIRESSLKEIN